jgi:hypothetical protein
MTTITVTRPATVMTPRGATWGAEIAARVLNSVGQLFASRAELIRRKSRTAEAAAVRQMADEVRKMDPRFAADLYAAADRHETE